MFIYIPPIEKDEIDGLDSDEEYLTEVYVNTNQIQEVLFFCNPIDRVDFDFTYKGANYKVYGMIVIDSNSKNFVYLSKSQVDFIRTKYELYIFYEKGK